VADDAALFRTGLVLVLESLGVEIACEAASGAELLARIRKDPPDIAIVDIMMNGRYEGISTAAELRAAHPDLGILVLSGHAEVAYATELGVAVENRYGYLLKERVADGNALRQALEHIAEGGVVIDPSIVAKLLGRPAHRSLVDQLSPPELKVLAAMAQGLSNEGVAKLLRISPRTVEGHVSRIFSQLGLAETSTTENRRVQAVLTFLRSTASTV
jgi:DNA-binding NarL/FixJ family response regulator